jgi:hypothetical protein
MALHCGSFCFTTLACNPSATVKFSQPIVKASVFPSTLSSHNVRLNVKGKSILGFYQFLVFVLNLYFVAGGLRFKT